MMHLRIAEQGKLFSLKRNFTEALRYYREAIRMLEPQNIQGKDLFFQHYSQCVMETLELSGSHEEVLNYCYQYLTFLEEKSESDTLVNALKAHILEKMAVQYLYLDEYDEAKGLLQESKNLAGEHKQPITDQLLMWLQRGYTINQKQIADLLKKNNYYIVRDDTVNRAIALELPKTTVSPC